MPTINTEPSHREEACCPLILKFVVVASCVAFFQSMFISGTQVTRSREGRGEVGVLGFLIIENYLFNE